MKLWQHLSETHAALVEFYQRTEVEHLRGELAECISLLQQAIDLEKEREQHDVRTSSA